MSQALLILKKEEWSRRNWTMGTQMSENGLASNVSASPNLERRYNGSPSLVEDDRNVEERITMTSFTPVRDDKDQDEKDLDEKDQIGVVMDASLPSDSEDTDRASPTSLVSTDEESSWIMSSPSSECGNDEQRRIRDLEMALQGAQKEMARLKQAADSADLLRIKMQGNLKKKRADLDQALLDKTRLEKEVDEFAACKTQLMEENASLKLGLQNVAVTKDTIKAKLKTKDELLKECQKEKDLIRQQLQQMEHVHTVERELLEHYRKLARHTGYYRWGKPIRTLEAQLAERGAGEPSLTA